MLIENTSTVIRELNLTAQSYSDQVAILRVEAAEHRNNAAQKEYRVRILAQKVKEIEAAIDDLRKG